MCLKGQVVKLDPLKHLIASHCLLKQGQYLKSFNEWPKSYYWLNWAVEVVSIFLYLSMVYVLLFIEIPPFFLWHISTLEK